jgi:hypothetical protein
LSGVIEEEAGFSNDDEAPEVAGDEIKWSPPTKQQVKSKLGKSIQKRVKDLNVM